MGDKEFSPEEIQQIRAGRGRFISMAGAYCLGVFNDNFYKQAAALVAVFLAQEQMKSIGALIYTLPWLLFAAPAGWLADRFPKKNVVIAAKGLELIAMISGGIGIILVNWPLVMVMMFLMALQSTIFSPALNGSIPELYPDRYVIRANSKLKMLVNVGNLVGIILAGVALNYAEPMWGLEGKAVGRAIVGVGVIAVAAVGFLVSFGVSSGPAADRTVRFPWTGPVDTVRRLWRTREDKLLAAIIVADAFFWFVAVLQILIITETGRDLWRLNEQQTSYLLVTELLGVGLGGLLAGWLSKGEHWYRVLVPGFLLLTLFTGLIVATPYIPGGQTSQIIWLASCLLLAGAAGGFVMVPMESFFQTRPSKQEKGGVIAAANFAGFFAMGLSAVADALLRPLISVTTTRFAVVAAGSLVAALSMRRFLRKQERDG